jgi:hypothetical protein
MLIRSLGLGQVTLAQGSGRARGRDRALDDPGHAWQADLAHRLKLISQIPPKTTKTPSTEEDEVGQMGI